MSLRGKLIVGFGGLLLILLLVSGLSIVVLTRYSHELDRVFSENYNSVVYCGQMKQVVDDLQSRAQRILWDDLSQHEPDDLTGLEAQFDKSLRLQFANVTLQGEGRLTDVIESLWNTYRSTYATFAAASDHQRRLGIFRSELIPQSESLRATAQATADLNMKNMVSVDGNVKRMLESMRETLIVLAGVGTLLSVGLVAAVGTTLLHPLRTLTNSARRIEGGDLELKVDVAGRDEIGQLAEAFNSMAARLREFRRMDHERLQVTQETTQLAIDSLPDAVFVIRPGGVVEISNRTARSHFSVVPGATVDSLKLIWLSKIYADVCSTREPLDPVGYNSAIQLFEAGQERFLLPRAVPMVNAAGALTGVTVILVDVTRLRHADELKSGLVSTVSHELRTPLTTIRMGVLMLASEKLGPVSPTQKKVLMAARDDSDRLCRIIENLLSMSRIESGGQQFQFRPMEAEEIVRQATEPLREQFDAKPLTLSIDLAPHLPQVMADPSCVGYALSNLLLNAIKFTPAGGAVQVAVRTEGELAVFSVADMGPGIAPEFRSRLFQRFFRVPNPGGPSGAGLGLSIVKEIVEAHSGTIAYLERPGGGSIFQFTLPRVTSA
jgi:two-component system, NtrC family, sensor histidine kinase KinB